MIKILAINSHMFINILYITVIIIIMIFIIW